MNKLDAPGMKGYRTRNHIGGRLHQTHSNKKLATVKEEYGDSFLPGLPDKPEGLITVGDLRKYESDAAGEDIVGLKKLHAMVVHDFLPSIPGGYLARIALASL